MADMNYQVGDLIARKNANGKVEKAVVEKVQTAGSALIDGTQVPASVGKPIVTARIVVVDGQRVLKTKAVRQFVVKEENGESEDEYYGLTERQKALYDATESIVEAFGQFDKGHDGNGAHYMNAADNPFVNSGMKCANCVAYEGGRHCEWVSGDIDPQALCKLWVISEPLLAPQGVPVLISERELGITKEATFTPPQGVQDAAKRAVGWIQEGKAGNGFTAVGSRRAHDLANGRAVSLATVKRMANFLSRHEVDKKAEGFSQGEKGYPSAGRVAWDAWGGDAARSWTQSIIDRVEKSKSVHRMLKSAEEARFTLAPWYIPDKYDAHQEWTDASELQKALWDYVESGDRDIRLQHNRDIKAGKWVEAMTLPYEWSVPVHKANGEMGAHVYPSGTVLLGVVWEPWAWEMVKKGEITGFSIGGSAERVNLEMPA